jgi:hypothetical protein
MNVAFFFLFLSVTSTTRVPNPGCDSVEPPLPCNFAPPSFHSTGLQSPPFSPFVPFFLFLVGILVKGPRHPLFALLVATSADVCVLDGECPFPPRAQSGKEVPECALFRAPKGLVALWHRGGVVLQESYRALCRWRLLLHGVYHRKGASGEKGMQDSRRKDKPPNRLEQDGATCYREALLARHAACLQTTEAL